MTKPDQRCGTCKWWENDHDWRANPCAAPVPNSVMVEGRDLMTAVEGHDCPAWAPIENGETQA